MTLSRTVRAGRDRPGLCMRKRATRLEFGRRRRRGGGRQASSCLWPIRRPPRLCGGCSCFCHVKGLREPVCPAMRGILEACTDAELAAIHVRIAAPSPDLLKPGHDSFRSELASYKEHFVPEGAEAAAAAAALRRGGRPRFALRDNAVQDEVPWDRFAFFREKMLLNDRRNGKCGRWVR